MFQTESVGSYNLPYGATAFNSYGNYGSHVFDPVGAGGLRLEINICDQCMLKHKERIVMVRIRERDPLYEIRPWDPEAEY